jgi:hypothetical protein
MPLLCRRREHNVPNHDFPFRLIINSHVFDYKAARAFFKARDLNSLGGGARLLCRLIFNFDGLTARR